MYNYAFSQPDFTHVNQVNAAGNATVHWEPFASVGGEEFWQNEIKILDVRNEGEINSSSLDSSIKIPLKTLENNLNKLNQNNKYYIHCAGGYRSMIAASIMKKNGFNNLVNVSKGYSGIKKCLINI